MGQFTTISRDLKQSFLITKYVLLFFIVMNIMSTIWVGIYNKNMVDWMEVNFPDDRWTGDKGKGSSARVWERLCITFLVFENIFNVLGICGALQENYCLSILYSVMMFLCALYGATAKYTRGSVCAYLNPLIVAIIASVFAHMIRMDNYEPSDETKTKSKTQTKPKIAPKPEPIYTAPNKPAKQSLTNPLISDSRRSSDSPGSAQKDETTVRLNGYKSRGSSGSTGSTAAKDETVVPLNGYNRSTSRSSSSPRSEQIDETTVPLNGYNKRHRSSGSTSSSPKGETTVRSNGYSKNRRSSGSPRSGGQRDDTIVRFSGYNGSHLSSEV